MPDFYKGQREGFKRRGGGEGRYRNPRIRVENNLVF
jgi:hypothetical protein